MDRQCVLPTYADGIQNDNENSLDCGDCCAACPKCSEGIQTEAEVGIDCPAVVLLIETQIKIK